MIAAAATPSSVVHLIGYLDQTDPGSNEKSLLFGRVAPRSQRVWKKALPHVGNCSRVLLDPA